MDLSQMFSNPQLGGKVLFGGWGSGMMQEQNMLVMGVVAILAVAFVLYIIWMYYPEKFDTQFYGVGPSASHIPGEGTYGYAQALTYQNQREPQELAEYQLLMNQRAADLKKEGFADTSLLMLEEFDGGYKEPQDTLGYPQPIPERMTNAGCPTNTALRSGGVHEVMRRISRVPFATGEGATTHSVYQLQKARKQCRKSDTENMANIVPFIPISNTSVVADPMEAYTNLRQPRRTTYREGYEGTDNALNSRRLVAQDDSPNIGMLGAPFGFVDPTQVDLAGGLGRKENFGLNSYHKKKGSELTGYYTPSYSAGAVSNDGRVPYTSDRAQFLTLFKQNKDANVVESDCDANGRCKISFVGNPDNLGGELANLVNQLTNDERNELLALSGRYTRYQLNARERLQTLKQKQANKNLTFTSSDKSEVDNLIQLLKISGRDIDRYNVLVEKSALRLSSMQYIVPAQTPSNACQVKAGLRYYGPEGKLQRLTKFVPANACDYDDMRMLTRQEQNLNGLSEGDVQKIGDAVSRITKQ